jgi:P27 family predicted phage terminase small subunit
LNEIAQEEWRRIILSLYRLRLVTSLDLNVLAAYCNAYARWNEAETTLAAMAQKDPVTKGVLIRGAHGTPVVNPLVRVASVAAKDMVHFAGEFGLSPLARARIAAGVYENPPRSKFDGLIPGG